LTSLTNDQIDALAPVDRQLLRHQLERVHHLIAGGPGMSDVRRAMSPEGGEREHRKAAFLDELRDGKGRE
jgi:hypothetical protein